MSRSSELTIRSFKVISASKMSLALSIAEQCLPYLRKGFSSREDLKNAVSIILSSGICSSVIITDRQEVLAWGQTDSNLDIDDFRGLPLPAKQAMEDNQFVTLTETKNNTRLKGILRYHTIIAAPLTKMDQPVGCLMVFVRRRWINLEADISFVKGVPFLVALLLSVSNGSATVSLLTASAIILPLLPSLGIHPVIGTLAIAAGSSFFYHANASHFWVVVKSKDLSMKKVIRWSQSVQQ
ncbi:GntT/GntP/DsdX family permease [Desulfosporosinus shakirovi]|uniref:GntT/GntP/DsdX family permease n=1 Tax=Desulfosporosinus shakirovi TaxID=2885154 RepID=UPI001E385C17|nr:hypothetical protein [Desulfosporosinus sp. SRJS8]MCB8817797.1 hypothetical protein [Desulfosporosinus sp. SRJS8]